MKTRDVALGNGLTVTIRTPRFAVWSEYERLIFQPEDEPKDREERIVANYEAREKGREEEPAVAPPAPPLERKLVGERARRVLDYVTGELLPDCIVAFKDGDERVVCLTEESDLGEPVKPYPVSFRDLGPHRVMLIAPVATEMVRDSLGYSFRLSTVSGNGAEGARPRKSKRAEPASHPAAAGRRSGSRAVPS